MPAPPPPPPPGMPSLAPPPSVDTSGRSQLLLSIQKGAKLKKTVVNDRSAPLVDANKRSGAGIGSGGSGSNSGGSSPSKGPGGRNGGVVAPPGLAGLFAGGMPKLKSVGSAGIQTGRTERRPSPPSEPQSPRNIGGFSNISNKPPPPQPPPSNTKPPTSHSNQSSISSDPGSDRTDSKRGSYGKPMLAPKPPALNSSPNPRPPPPPKLFIPPPPPIGSDSSTSSPTSAGSAVNRAQSMRVPKIASPTGSNSLESRTIGRSAGKSYGAAAANQPPPPPRFIGSYPNGGGAPGPRRNTPLRAPTAKPPPPPNQSPPAAPPPPPPANGGPPPPPHRIVPAPPPPPPPALLNKVNGLGSAGNLCPPPPPTRNSSMKSVISVGSSHSSPMHTGIDLDSRFGHLFHRIETLPEPEPFKGFVKTYPSKTAQSTKRSAPIPPKGGIHLGSQINSSTC